MKQSNKRYRVLERIGTSELWCGLDEESEFVSYGSNSVTYYDDRFFVCHEDTAKTRMRGKVKDKKPREEKEVRYV